MGQGPIGLLLMMLAKLEGATVLTQRSDGWAARTAASAIRRGASRSIRRQWNLCEEMRSRTNGRGADAVLLAVPSPALVDEALAIARPGGRVLLFAHNDPVMQHRISRRGSGRRRKRNYGQL